MSVDQRIEQPRERIERERSITLEHFEFDFHTDEQWDPIEATLGTIE